MDFWFDVLTSLYRHFQSGTEKRSVSDFFVPYGAQSVISIHQRPLFVRQAERCVSLKRRCYVVCTCGACFQRFKVSPLRCFRVSKFHCFAVSMFHCFAVSEFHRTCGAVSKFQVSPPRYSEFHRCSLISHSLCRHCVPSSKQ